MSTLKADAVTTKSDDTDLTLTGGGTGVPNLEAGFKVGGSAGVPTASIQDDAVTLAKLAAGTDGELITWDASGDPAAVAVGTATHVLTSNGAGAAPTFQAAAAGGAWTLISSTVASDDANITITGLTSTYESYACIVSEMIPATDDTRLYFRMGDSSGIDSGVSDYAYAATGLTSVSTTAIDKNGNLEPQIILAPNGIVDSVGNTAGEGVCSRVMLYPNLGSAQYPRMSFESSIGNAAGNETFFIGSGMRNSNITLDRVQVIFQSGNITSGRFTVWGIKHT